MPIFVSEIRAIRSEIDKQDDFFIKTVKDLNVEVKEGFACLD